MFVFLANFLPLYLRIYFSIFIFQLSCIRWVTLGCDRRTPVPTRPCPYNPSYQLCPLLTQHIALQYFCWATNYSSVLTQPPLPQVGWPYNLLVARLRLLVPGSPSQSSVGQTQGPDVWASHSGMYATYTSRIPAYRLGCRGSDTHGTHHTHLLSLHMLTYTL